MSSGVHVCRRTAAAPEGVVAAIDLEQCKGPCVIDGEVADGCVVAVIRQEARCACVAPRLTQTTKSQRRQALTQLEIVFHADSRHALSPAGV